MLLPYRESKSSNYNARAYFHVEYISMISETKVGTDSAIGFCGHGHLVGMSLYNCWGSTMEWMIKLHISELCLFTVVCAR